MNKKTAKAEINVGDFITTELHFKGERAMKVDSIREVEGIKMYYVTCEGLMGTHVVSEEQVEDHATADEYAKALAEKSGSVDEDESEETGAGHDAGNGSSGESDTETSSTSTPQTTVVTTPPTSDEAAKASAANNSSNGGKQNQNNSGNRNGRRL
jgi:hypothetical protein